MSKYDFLVIIGCGGHARSIAEVALHNKLENLVFLDKNAKDGETIFGFAVCNVLNLLEPIDASYIPGVGDNNVRKQIVNELMDINKEVVSITSSLSYISKNTTIGVGTFIGHYAYIGPLVKIGNGCIVNTSCVIEHDCIIGDYSHISVNTTLCGKVTVGSNCLVGAGATVIDGVTICDNVTIGAGAVVTHNISIPGSYVGVPARLNL